MTPTGIPKIDPSHTKGHFDSKIAIFAKTVSKNFYGTAKVLKIEPSWIFWLFGNFRENFLEFLWMLEKMQNSAKMSLYISLMTLITWLALIESERFRLPLMTMIILLIKIIFLKLKFNLDALKWSNRVNVNFGQKMSFSVT